MLIDFRERGVGERENELEKEKNIGVREKDQLVASHLCPDWLLNPQPRYEF